MSAGPLSLGTIPVSSAASGQGSDKGGEKTPGLGGATTFRGATSASSSPTRRKRDIDSALAAWAGTSEPCIETTAGAHRKTPSPLSSAANLNPAAGSSIKDKGLDSPSIGGSGASSTSGGSGSSSGSSGSSSPSSSAGSQNATKGRMFKLMTRTTSVKDNKDTTEAEERTTDFFADRHLFSGGTVRADVIHMLTGFLLDNFPRENLLTYFVPSSCQNWRKIEHLSPIVAEFLHFIVVQRDAPLSNFEDSLRQMLRSAPVSDVCAFFWIYVSSSSEPTVPAELYQRFVTVASLISQDVICGVLRSVYRRLPPQNAAIFRDIACFGHALLHDSEKSHRESLARVFISPYTGRRALDGDLKHRPAEEITCQWLFFFAPKVVNLDSDLWERKKSFRTGADSTNHVELPSENQSRSDLSLGD